MSSFCILSSVWLDRKALNPLLPHSPLSSVSELPPSSLCSPLLAVMHGFTASHFYCIGHSRTKDKLKVSKSPRISACCQNPAGSMLFYFSVCVFKESGAGLCQPLQIAVLCIVPSACCPSSHQQWLTV